MYIKLIIRVRYIRTHDISEKIPTGRTTCDPASENCPLEQEFT